MSHFINYLLEANLSLLLFLGFFLVLYTKETNFFLLRLMLLIGVITSLIFPLIHLQNSAVSAQLMQNVLPSLVLPALYVNGVPDSSLASPQSFTLLQTLSYVYIAGFGFFLFLFLFRIFKLALLIANAKKIWEGNLCIAETSENTPSFSFFNFVFIGEVSSLTARERDQIILHESVYVRQYHSIDILLINIIGIFFWFNPLLRTYKNLFIQLHEFEADARSVKNEEVDGYCNLLARVALLSADIRIANHFANSLTLKRIQMMRQNKSAIKPWKIACMIGILPLLFIFIACHDQVSGNITDIAESSTVALDVPADVQAKYDEMKAKNPEKELLLVEVDQNGQAKVESLRKKIEQLPPESISSVNVIKHPIKPGESEFERAFIIVEYDEDVQNIIEQSKSDDNVYSVVDESSKPAGGLEKFYEFLMANIKYPEEARDKGVAGKVFLDFIVEPDGSLSNVTVKKGIHASLDEEALRVMKISPKWIPGKVNGVAIRQRVVLPINFSLQAKKESEKVGFFMTPLNPFKPTNGSEDKC